MAVVSLRFAFALLSGAFATTASAQTQIVFGTYTSEQPAALVNQLRPALDVVSHRMTQDLGGPVTIRMEIVPTYEEGVQLIVDRRADFMRVGPASYIKARQKDPGISLLVVESQRGKSTFNGVIAVHRDSDVRDIRDLRGKSFAFGSPESTLGRYFAQQRLLRAGIRANDLVRFAYLDQHDKVGLAVGSGLFDAGALEETMFRKLADSGTPIRILTTYPNVTRPWIARSRLDPKLFEALRKALLTLDDKTALQAMRFDGFLDGREADFEPTRQAITESRLFDEPRR
jgi:phosphonate transport system substrate-binding protein